MDELEGDIDSFSTELADTERKLEAKFNQANQDFNLAADRHEQLASLMDSALEFSDVSDTEVDALLSEIQDEIDLEQRSTKVKPPSQPLGLLSEPAHITALRSREKELSTDELMILLEYDAEHEVLNSTLSSALFEPMVDFSSIDELEDFDSDDLQSLQDLCNEEVDHIHQLCVEIDQAIELIHETHTILLTPEEEAELSQELDELMQDDTTGKLAVDTVDLNHHTIQQTREPTGHSPLPVSIGPTGATRSSTTSTQADMTTPQVESTIREPHKIKSASSIINKLLNVGKSIIKHLTGFVNKIKNSNIPGKIALNIGAQLMKAKAAIKSSSSSVKNNEFQRLIQLHRTLEHGLEKNIKQAKEYKGKAERSPNQKGYDRLRLQALKHAKINQKNLQVVEQQLKENYPEEFAEYQQQQKTNATAKRL